MTSVMTSGAAPSRSDSLRAPYSEELVVKAFWLVVPTERSCGTESWRRVFPLSGEVGAKWALVEKGV
jgi:hypothetical protein